MKQTAVEWLEAIIKHCERFGTNVEQKDIDEAKQLEKDIIRNAFLDGQDEMREQCNCNTEHSLSSLEYYKKTFKK